MKLYRPDYTKKVSEIDGTKFNVLTDEINFYTKVEVLDLFIGGSYMGNMANETSDVDLCVHYKTQPKIEDHLKMKKELKNKHGKGLSVLYTSGVVERNFLHGSILQERFTFDFDHKLYRIGSLGPGKSPKHEIFVKFKKYPEFLNKVKGVYENHKDQIHLLQTTPDKKIYVTPDMPDIIKEIYKEKNEENLF